MALKLATNPVVDRLGWVKITDTKFVYYRKRDERLCGNVSAVYNSTDWEATDSGVTLGHYRTVEAALKAVETSVERE